MTDQELFFKYNMITTRGRIKDETLDKDIFYNRIIKNLEEGVRRQVLVLLHGSYACNLKCIYCENQCLREEYKNTPTIKEETVREIVKKLNNSIREVTWHGGEPLLLPDNLLLALEDEKKRLNLDFKTTLQTNSLLLSKEKEQFLTDHNISWGTSFDGLKNDNSRGSLSTESILRCLKEFPDKIGFISVTHKDTIDLLIDNYEYYKSIGVKTMQNCIVRENVISGENDYLVKNDVAVSKMLEFIDYWIHDTNNPINDAYVRRQINRLIGDITVCEDSNCIGGWLIIDPEGNITHCGHSGKEDSIINIKDIDNSSDLFNHPKYLKMINKQRKLMRSCRIHGCKWYSVCYGGCMGMNYEYDHNYEKISPRNCEYIRNLLEGIYELIKDIDITETNKYNSLFLDMLKSNNYYSLSEIKEIERKYHHG